MTPPDVPDGSEVLRRQIQSSLPERVRAALSGYERFTAEEPPADAKGFAVWHAAAKAALAHVEVLVKLMRWAEGPTAAESDGDGLEDLLGQARRAIDRYRDDEDED